MKRHPASLAIAFALLSACGPTESQVATAISQTQAALPTPTAEPTRTPTKTPTITATPGRQTALNLDFATVDTFLTKQGFVNTGSSTCLLRGVPMWVECQLYGYMFSGEVGQMAEVMHEGETVVGLSIVFNGALAQQHPNDLTTAIGLIDLLELGMPFSPLIWPESPAHITEDSVVLTKHEEGDFTMYTYLDPAVAEDVFP